MEVLSAGEVRGSPEDQALAVSLTSPSHVPKTEGAAKERLSRTNDKLTWDKTMCLE